MNSEMTLLAVAGSGGVLGARGPGALTAAAAPVRCRRSTAASQPMPMPAFWRNRRRESSIDIDELAHVKDQQAKPRQGVAAEEFQRSFAFRGGRRSAEGQFPAGIHGG